MKRKELRDRDCQTNISRERALDKVKRRDSEDGQKDQEYLVS